MKLEIETDPKLDWSYVNKVKLKLHGDGLNYEAPLSIQELSRLHFITGVLLTSYYAQDKK